MVSPWYNVVRYDTVRYCTVRYGGVWITNDNVFTKMFRSFELSKNRGKIKVLSVAMRSNELGNIG